MPVININNDDIRLNSSSSDKVVVNGNLGIGTTSPATLLHVSNAGSVTGRFSNTATSVNTEIGVSGGLGYVGTQSANAFGIVTSDTERMRITGDGNVGIGTTSPSTKLEVGNFLDAVTNKITVAARYEYEPEFNFRLGQSGTNLDWIGAVISSGDDGNYNGKILFKTANVGRDTPTTKMVIKANGNVGIGTTSPTAKLFIEGNDITLNTEGSAQGKTLYFRYSNGANVQSDSYLYFSTGGSPTEKMRITDGGNVGIGTTSPSTKLDVIGVGAFGTMTSSRGLYSNGLSIQNNTGEATSLFLWQSGVASAHIGSPANSTSLYIVNSYNTGLITDPNSIVLTNTGNVGIGTTSPESKLHVAGGDVLISNGQYYTAESTTGGNYKLAGLTSGNVIVIGAIDYTSAGTIFAGGDNVSITTGGVAGSSRIYINSTGNVGIGTTSPTNKLQVTGGRTYLETGNEIYTLGISRSGANAYYLGVSNSSSPDLYFSNNAGTTRVTLTDAGNVGIGTTSPSYNLHIVGTGYASQYFASDYYRDSRLEAMLIYAGSNQIRLGSGVGSDFLTFYGGGNERMRIDSSGNVGIGTTAPQQLIHVLGATNGYAMIQGASDSGQAGIYFKKEDTTGTMDRTKGLIVFHTNVGSGWGRGHLGFCLNSSDNNTVVSVSDEKFRMVDNGDFLADGDVVAYSTTISDARYKTNIQPIESALDKVNQMRGVSFDWTAVRSGREFGVIAQEIEQIAPEVVSEKELLNGDTMKTVSYTSLVPFLIESIKELTQQVNELKAKLDGLTK